MMQFLKITIVFLLISSFIYGCGASAARYQPIVDGPKDQLYYSDLKECQSLAEQRSYLNDDVKTNALLGTGMGALAGALSNDWEGALVGAGLGAVAGAGSRAWETRDERRNIVCKCMAQRGHKVVEN
jgi:hypothetical protein